MDAQHGCGRQSLSEVAGFIGVFSTVISVPEEILMKLKSFMLEMREWEVCCFRDTMALINIGGSTAESDEIYRKKLESIFEKYTLEDRRGWARLELLGVGSPPMYDPERDVIGAPELGKGEARVSVQQVGGLEEKFRFTLSRTGGVWRIKRKDTHRNDKWEKSTL